MKKIIILGAGPSGLGVAWGLVEKGYKNIVLIEKESVLGGLCRSFQLGKMTLDFGPHRLSPEHPEIVDRVKDLLGDELLEVSNDHGVVFRNRFYSYPPRAGEFFNFTTLWIGLRVILSWGYERVKSFLLSPFLKGNRREDFEAIIVRQFGRRFYEEIVEPLCHKIWGNPRLIDPHFAKVRFSLPSAGQWVSTVLKKKGKFNDECFYYPRKGFQQIWTTLGAFLEERGVEIVTEAKLIEINADSNKISSLVLESPRGKVEIETQWVFNTIPIQHFIRLIQPKPRGEILKWAPQFANLGMLLIIFLVKKTKSLPARVLIFPEKKYSFNRLYEQNQFSRETIEEGKSAITADIITEVSSKTWAEKDGEICNQVKKEILTLGYFSEDQIESIDLVRVPISYPQPTSMRENAQREINQALSQYKNLVSTGRFATSDYNNSHTALKKGFEAAKVLESDGGVSVWYDEAEKLRQIAIRD